MFRIDRRLINNFDWLMVSVVIIIVLIGIMTIYSATRPLVEGETSRFYLKQSLWLIIGVIALFIMVSFDYIWMKRLSFLLYAASIALLVIVFVLGKVGMGAQRWLSIGPISFQPSEFFKVAYVIMLSHQLGSISGPISTPSLFRLFFLIVLPPFILLIKQPDLGTGLIMLTVFFSLLFAKGIHRKIVVLLVIIGLISLPFLGNILWEGLRDYQKSRLIAFLEPGVDPSGIGYHINQSKISVGSGKFFGKGYLNGTQGPLRFLPEKHTDFIFAIFAEEWGFFGSLVLISLYIILLLRGPYAARNARDDFGKFLALGITFMFLTYVFINVGMTLGIMPVVGIPLPFMSYGGTALLSNLLSVGLIINIRTRRFELFH